MTETPRSTIFALMLLTLVTGIVDAASVLGLGHVFTANMTGNVVFLGFAVVGKGSTSALASIEALGCFFFGALVGGRVSKVLTTRAIRVGFGLELSALTLAAAAALSPGAVPIVIALLAFSMGLRNAIIRKLAIPDMTTTVLTLTVTGLAADSFLAGGTNPRLPRRVLAVVAMLAGAALGAALLSSGMGVVVGAATAFETVAILVLIRGYVSPPLKLPSVSGEHP